jgi:hypothetical protein
MSSESDVALLTKSQVSTLTAAWDMEEHSVSKSIRLGRCIHTDMTQHPDQAWENWRAACLTTEAEVQVPEDLPVGALQLVLGQLGEQECPEGTLIYPRPASSMATSIYSWPEVTYDQESQCFLRNSILQLPARLSSLSQLRLIAH